MAALDVVKRRLDAVGVGDMCLELRSKKANKRDVLQELNRTWLLGSPSGAANRDLTDTLDSLRQHLSAHPARLHTQDDTTQLTPYEVMGHLVRLRRTGVAPTDIELAGAPRWSPADRERMRRGLADLAARIDEVGLPATHAWRGAMVEVVLPMDLQRLAGRISSLHSNLTEASSAGAELRQLLNAEFGDSLSGYRTLMALGAIVGAVPECDQSYLVAECWDTRRSDIEELVNAGEAYSLARLGLNGVLSDVAWTTDVAATRQQIAAHGSSWFRWFATDWRRADAVLRSLSAGVRSRALPTALPYSIGSFRASGMRRSSMAVMISGAARLAATGDARGPIGRRFDP
jgi:hypothetical protein